MPSNLGTYLGIARVRRGRRGPQIDKKSLRMAPEFGGAFGAGCGCSGGPAPQEEADFGAWHRIYRQPNGKLVHERSPVIGGGQRPFGAAGLSPQEARMDGYDDIFGQVGNDFGAMDYPSLGGPLPNGFAGQLPVMGGMDYPSLGAAAKARQIAALRAARAQQRFIPRGPANIRVQQPQKAPAIVQQTVLTTQDLDVQDPGNYNLVIRPQVDFIARDLSFTGTRAATGNIWIVETLKFGEHNVLTNPVPVTYFANDSFIRDVIKGGAIAAGLDISIRATLLGTATGNQPIFVQIAGLKRQTAGCLPSQV